MTIDVLEDSSVVLSDTSSCTCSRNGVAESLIEGDEVRMYSMYSIVLCYVFYINFLRIFSLLLLYNKLFYYIYVYFSLF